MEMDMRNDYMDTINVKMDEKNKDEQMWDEILECINPDEVSDDFFEYLLSNEISIMTLCHMKLKDEWLFKLVDYDDEPIYTLAERYYLGNEYTIRDFISFYKKYLMKQPNICLWLLQIEATDDKKKLLQYLNNYYQSSCDAVRKALLGEYVKNCMDSEEIENIYYQHIHEGVVLVAIAGNLYTPLEILSELTYASGVQFASKIRKCSRETLMIKKLVEV